MSARRRRRWPWIMALVLVAGGGTLVARGRTTSGATVDPALVVTVKRAPLVIDISETGRVTAREQVELKSKVAGQVVEVLVQEGEAVKKGQLLLRLDPTDAQRDVARAEAEVAQAQAAIGYAKLVRDRRDAGVRASVIAAHELDAARHELTEKEIALRLARVSLGAAQDRLRYTKVSAPLDGTVIQRNIEPGEVVTPGVQSTFEGKPLLTVADLSTLVVKVDLNQIDVAKVALGQAATVTVDALPGNSYQGKVTRIAPASERLPGREVDVFPIEVELTAGDGQIKPGMTADVRIRVDERPSALALPIEALQHEKTNDRVFVALVFEGPKGEQVTEKVEVKLGARNDREVEITGGLDEGSRVLIDPPSAAENETKL